MRILLLAMLFVSGIFPQSKIYNIYNGVAPGTEGMPNLEKIDSGRVTSVYQPQLIEFSPVNADEKHTAIIICPGGGYRRLAIEKEGYKIAKRLAVEGYHCFVLKYRLNAAQALRDAQRSVSYVRSRHRDFSINPGRVVVLGFSAGGHLSANAAVNFNRDKTIMDGVDSLSSRPDYAASIYGLLEPRSRKADSALYEYTLSKMIDKETPPFFVVHSADDPVVPVEFSLKFCSALRDMKIPVEMHIYETGGHGYGIEEDRGPAAKWIDSFAGWLKNQK